VAKFSDHLPLYRQEAIFGRAGYVIPRSTLGAWVGACGVQLQPLVDALKQAILGHQVLHADETPVAMLKPGNGKTHRAYLWNYSPGAFEAIKAVVYDFTETRSGMHAQAFLGAWRGKLVCDDYSGYKALLARAWSNAGASRIIWSAVLSGAPSRMHRFPQGLCPARPRINPRRSERLQEREQIRLGPPGLGLCWLDPGVFPEVAHGIALHLQVGRDVAPGGGHARVAEIVADHSHVGARLQQRRRAAVAKSVWGDAHASECRVLGCDGQHLLAQDVGDTVGSQRLLVTVHEDMLLAATHRHPPQPVQRVRRLAPKGQQPLLLALAAQAHLPRRHQLQVVPSQICKPRSRGRRSCRGTAATCSRASRERCGDRAGR
jgi:transposase IS66 family protein